MNADMKLYVVGLGPGDPSLVTLKALDTVLKSDIIYVPCSGGEHRIARSILEKLFAGKNEGSLPQVKDLEFPMTRDHNYNKSFLEKNVAEIISDLAKHKILSYAVIGSPTFYSTFGKIKQMLEEKGVSIEYVPGVNSVDACSARSSINIASGDDSVLVTTYRKLLEIGSFEKYDTVVIMKVPTGSFSLERIRNLMGDGMKYIYARRCTMDSEFITEKAGNEDGDYFSLVIARRY
ncbi:precorrin-2 c20-methyltransferase [Thermoplasma volcanium GSS1]|uniref:Precorrin-2 c20-methyltransferase n=1 Tax=Thermoplasma volcanium (strain ATCC 51530 / DSM 4299 / JCM 9571 / NBRC 15438 / GSS1) TaxID=273116 RepID=Q97A65_THEVO|nr:precorrin-2 C(20)-methyltransferase [Thermoplasma volcanium]BAB60087.1 precorrin-2 c20-methyltransferase [Thermoplasma volcanium GSS1]